MKILSEKQKNFVLLFALIFSFIIFLVGIHMFLDELNFKKYSKVADATITNIKIDCDNIEYEICDYEVEITYNVDGVDYNNTITYYNSSMRVGGKTKIYYDINDPMHISSGNTGLLFLGLGFTFTLFLSIMLIINIKKMKSNKIE